MANGTYIGKKEYEVFKKECRHWIERFGLTDWKVYYTFEELDDALAGCSRDYEGRVATLTLNPFQENLKRRDVNVKASAKHEVMHILLAELRWMSHSRVLTDQAWMAAEHAVIRRLEDALK